MVSAAPEGYFGVGFFGIFAEVGFGGDGRAGQEQACEKGAGGREGVGDKIRVEGRECEVVSQGV